MTSSILDAMSDHVIFYEQDDMIIKWCNKAAADSLGMKPNDVLGKHCYELWHNSSEPCSFCPVKEAFATGEHIEKETKTPDGRAWLVRGQPMFNQQGEIIGAVEITRDITESVRANEALRESEEKYRTIVNSMEDIVFLFDKDDRYAEYYAADEALLIVPPEKFLNRHIANVLPSDIADLFLTNTKFIREIGKSVTFDYPLEIRDHIYWFSATLSLHDDGKSIVAVMRDISERKLAEEALQESEEKFRNIFKASPIGIQLFDSDANLIDANNASMKMVGVERLEDFVGFNLYSDPHTPEAIKEKMRDQVSARYTTFVDFEKIRELELYRTNKYGRIYLDCQITPLGKNPEGEFLGYLLQIQDITDRKKSEDELHNSHRDLELYAYLLRHDLGNDLQIILTEAENALIAYRDNPQVKDLSEVVMASAERMTRVLAFFGLEDVSFEQRLLPVLERCASQARKAHSGLLVRVHSVKENQRLRVNAGRMLNMVFDNLLRNSAVHGGLKPEVDIRITPHEDEVWIDVSDNGPGIPHEIKKNIFEKKAGGGMGLILSKRVLEIYGGAIKLLESRIGATFRVILPRA
jgi:PAS domain S-box-containing protein